MTQFSAVVVSKKSSSDFAMIPLAAETFASFKLPSSSLVSLYTLSCLLPFTSTDAT